MDVESTLFIAHEYSAARETSSGKNAAARARSPGNWIARGPVALRVTGTLALKL